MRRHAFVRYDSSAVSVGVFQRHPETNVVALGAELPPEIADFNTEKSQLSHLLEEASLVGDYVVQQQLLALLYYSSRVLFRCDRIRILFERPLVQMFGDFTALVHLERQIFV